MALAFLEKQLRRCLYVSDGRVAHPATAPQTNAVEVAGAASLRFLKGASLDATLSTTTAKHIPQIISASGY